MSDELLCVTGAASGYDGARVFRDVTFDLLRGERLAVLGKLFHAARHQIEALLGTPVYLDLRVKVLKEWQRDPKHLNRLGF